MPERTVVITLGRLPVALDLARSFHQAGWRVVVAEPFRMHLSRMSSSVDRSVAVTSPAESSAAYLDDLLNVVADERAALVVPVSEESTWVARLKQRLGESVRVFAWDPDTLLQLHDKYGFVRLAEAHGLRAPRSWLPDDLADLPSDIPLVVKPRHSCSGRGVQLLDAGRTPSPDAGSLVQAQIIGDEVSGFGVANEGRLAAPVVYRGTVRSGSVAVCFERIEELDAVTEWMRRFVAAVGYTGFIAFDFIIDERDKAWAIECNPRVTSGIHFLAAAHLAALVTGDANAAEPYRAERLLTESWSCYTAALGNVFRPARFLATMRELIRARDVTWSRSDPLPFLLMPVNTFRIIARAVRQGSSFAAVAVSDLEWQPAGD